MRQAYDYWQDQPGNCFYSSQINKKEKFFNFSSYKYYDTESLPSIKNIYIYIYIYIHNIFTDPICHLTKYYL